MNKIEKAFMEAVLTVSTITTGAGIVIKELDELATRTQETIKKYEKTEGSLTRQQWQELEKERQKFFDLLNDPKIFQKLGPDEKKKVNAIKREVATIFPVNKTVNFDPSAKRSTPKF